MFEIFEMFGSVVSLKIATHLKIEIIEYVNPVSQIAYSEIINIFVPFLFYFNFDSNFHFL